jgi:spore germination protein YaaH
MTGRARPSILALALGLALASVAPAAQAAPRPLTVGFYLPWDQASRAALVAHAARLDVLAPMSGALDSAQGTLRWQDDPARAPALAAAHGRARVLPVVSNAHDNVWDTAAADGALLDPAAGDAFIAALAAAARAQGYGGYILDFESLSPRAAPAYAPFLARLRAVLKPAGKELWVTAPLAAPAAGLQPLAQATDTVVLMAYDECWATGAPGPIAGQDWLEANLDVRLGPAPALDPTPRLDPTHVVVALGAYAYDWPPAGAAAVLSAGEAAALARRAGRPVLRAAPDFNPHLSYAAPDGQAHQVWWLDAAVWRAQAAAVQARRARGVALWRLGLEDPALWTAGPAPAAAAHPALPPPCAARRRDGRLCLAIEAVE